MRATATTPAPLRTGKISAPASSKPAGGLQEQEQISLRAYELYEQRGREDGHDLEDWLQAESEVPRPRAKAAFA